MSKQTALILGAGSDMAWAIAMVLKTNNYNLLLAARNVKEVEARVAALSSRDGITVIHFEATDFENHGKWFTSLPQPPDLTICVFGYLGDQLKAQSDWAEAKKIIDANYTGAVSILNAVAGSYRIARKGTIVGISSVAGDRGRSSNYMYGSAKAGFTAYLSGLRQSLSKEGVSVLTVKPGFVATKMTAGLNLPPALTSQPDALAKRVFGAIKNGKNVVYVGPIWFWIMTIIRFIPEGIFKKMKF